MVSKDRSEPVPCLERDVDPTPPDYESDFPTPPENVLNGIVVEEVNEDDEVNNDEDNNDEDNNDEDNDEDNNDEDNNDEDNDDEDDQGYKVLGMYQKYHSHDSDDNSRDYSGTRTYLLLENNGDHYRATFYIYTGECTSGHCSAKWADVDINWLTECESNNELRNIQFVPAQDIRLDIRSGMSYFSNDFLTFSHEGGDSCYPAGHYEFKMSFLRKK
jgi:hypothetical protein